MINGTLNDNKSEEFTLDASNGLGKLLGAIPTEREDVADDVEDTEEADKETDDSDDKSDDKPDGEEENKSEDKADKAEDKSEGDKDSNEEDETLKEFVSLLGIDEIEGDFEPTLEGMAQIAKQVADTSRKEGKIEGIKELFGHMPVVKQLVEHLADGLSIDTFLKQQNRTDWSKVILDEDKPEVLEAIYRRSLEAKGTDADEIEDLVEVAKDTNKLYQRADKGKEFLQKKEDALIQGDIDREKQLIKKHQDEQDAIVAEIDSILNTGNLAGIKLDKATAQSLEKFIFNTDDKGVTARDVKWNGLTNEQRVLLDYIVMNDFKPLGITTAAKEKEVKKIVAIKRSNDTKKKPDMNSSKSGSSSMKISSIKDLLGNND